MPHHEAAFPGHAAPAGTHGPADAELAAILPAITGPSGQFRHRQHINLAFLAVRRYGMPEAITRICDWIQSIAAYERALAARHPALLDKRLLSRHYRSSTLAADAARRGWVEPDLLPFPWSPPQDSRAG